MFIEERVPVLSDCRAGISHLIELARKKHLHYRAFIAIAQIASDVAVDT